MELHIHNLKISVALILFVSSICFAENFEQYTVGNGFWAPSGICVCDMNSDEFPDILGTAWNDDQVSLWMNSAETTPQWEEHVIDDELDGAALCSAADVNGDGFIDIAACGFLADAVVIYLAESADTWQKYVLTEDLVQTHEVLLEDVNGDGLPDLVAAAGGNRAVVLWLNTGSLPDSWDRYDVCIEMPGARSVCTGDFDLDGDMDIAGCALTCDDIRWWENSGSPVPQWTEHVVTDFFNGAHMIRSTDMNGDGVADLVCAGFAAGKIGVWLNSGTTPVEWEKHLTAGNFGLALGVEPVDLNDDGLIDISATSMNPDQLAIWFNNGDSLETWEKYIVDNSLLDAWPLGSADFNRDGRMDLTAGANGAGYIRWYANQITAGVACEETDQSMVVVSQNPSVGSVNFVVRLEKPELVSLTIHDLYGRTVCNLFSGVLPASETPFLWSPLAEGTGISSPGVYFIRAVTAGGELRMRKVTLLQ